MAEAAVGFLLQNLAQLLKYHGNLILDAGNQVQSLDKDLRMLRAFLMDLTNKRRKEEVYKELVAQTEEAVYAAEDVVDLFITQAAEKKFKISKPLLLHEIATKVQGVASEVSRRLPNGQSMMDMAKRDNAAGDEPNDDDKKVQSVREVNVVGFEDEEEKLIGYLKKKTDELDVITLVGLPGLGKTTLAGMIFRNREIEIEFPTRIWVYISQVFNRRNIFLQILSKLTTRVDDMKQKTDEELAKIVANLLNKQQFLIVMDDVWTTADWDKLMIALPSSGKVLVTSRQADVASYANRNRAPHMLRFLTPEESLRLLQQEVFGKGKFPDELKPVGEIIVQKCDRLPLAIVVIGGILVKKFSRKEPGARKREWEKVAEKVGAHLFHPSNDETNTMENIIALSYDKLPYHLKACFLYLGVFPEDCEIPASKLTRMWMAEGFVQDDDSFSLEETAESYLDELINRNLLRCEKVSRDGKVKTCRIHDTLRDFCIAEVKKKKSSRRHCVHSNLLNFVSSVPADTCVRSFVSFSKEEVEVPTKNASAIPSAFKLLRVLESKPMILPLFPITLPKLVHLRYVTLSMAKVDTLPAPFSKLWNIQTLIVHTKSVTLEVKADIWEMIHLRHFETNAAATLPKMSKGTPETQLQTLGRVSPESCTEEVITKVSKVKNLSIRGQLALLLGPKNVSFNNLGRLQNLEKLKLLNDTTSPGKLLSFSRADKCPPNLSLPQAEKFPPNLRSLTLTKTFLGWKNISILGELKRLEILLLKEKAFEGEIWNADDGGFKNLAVLHIQRIDFVKWTVSGRPFPSLRRLELKNCENLEMVPIELADVPNFQVLDLYRCKSAAASAKKVQERKEETAAGQEENEDGTNKFTLSIFPLHDT